MSSALSIVPRTRSDSPATRGRAPVKLLSDVPEVRLGAAPRPAPLNLKTADEGALLKAIAQWVQAGRPASAEDLAWVLVQRRNPGVKLGKKPRTPAEKAVTHLFLAQALIGDRNWDGAVDQTDRALAQDPRSLDALTLRAAALRHGGRWEEAIPAARAALALRPDIAPTLAVLFDSLMDLGRVAEAEAEARALIARAPGAFDRVRLAAGVLTRRGAVDEAVAALREVAAKDATKAAEALIRAGQALTTQGRHGEALPLYREAATKAPRLAAAHEGLICCLHAAGREAEALAAREEAEKRVPGFTGAHLDFWFSTDLPALGDGTGDPAQPLDPKRAVLVNGVGVQPAIPLGVASIKGYVEALGDFSCTIADLNAAHFKQVVGALRRGETAFDFEGRDRMDAAFATMEGDLPAYADLETYKRISPDLVLGFSLTERTFKTQLGRAQHRQGPVPWWVAAHARHILTARPAVVGFSITFTDQLAHSTQCARVLKALRPDLTIVFGGGFFKESNLEGFVAEPFVDAVILNEGEAAFLAFLEAKRDGADLSLVPGVVMHKADDLVSRAPNTFAVKQEDLPFANFSDLDQSAYLAPVPVYPVLSSRGCYWRRCTFCNHFASYANSYKTQSIERLIDELAHHAENGVRHFTFVDEMISAKRFKKISEEILARGLDIRFYALAKPTNDFDDEILGLMRKAGCLCIYWGMESGSERVLKMMDKGNDAAGSARTLAMASRAGIRNHLFLITGFPSETRAEMEETLAFLYANQANVDATVAGHFVLEMGTPAHDHHARFGIRRVYSQRTLCDHQLIDYDIEGCLDQPTAERYASILRPHFMDKLCAFGPFLGTPRDHVIAIYDANPDLPFPPPKDVPDPTTLAPLLDDPTATAEGLMDFTLKPLWHPERARA
jgi:tetratricopeptide (TPR) repeat protein/tRNA A37 methylthiotransferase MiaB